MKRNPNPPIRVNIGARAKAAAESDARTHGAARARRSSNGGGFRSGAERWGHSLLALLALVFCANPAAAVKVRVLAATHIEAVVERDPATSNGVVLRGTLRDDVGAPIPNSHVSISIHNEAGGGPALPLPRAERCSAFVAQGAHDPHIAPDEYVVDTDHLDIVED